MVRWAALAIALPLAAATPQADGLNRFAGDLYRRLAQGNPRENVVISPLSVAAALAMTLEGARGQTAEEMKAVLRTPLNGALLEQLRREGNSGGDELLLGQSLWVERAFPLLGDFVRANERQFGAAPRTADFSANPEAARAAINRWVGEQTRGRIEELFGGGSLGRDTRLVLASAVYFNGKWLRKFEPDDTAPAAFHRGPGNDLQVPFMRQMGRFPYAETAGAQVLEMPYGGGSLAFDVVLPKPGTPLGTLEGAFQSGGIQAWVGGLQRREVTVELPKFRADSAFSLKPALQEMGMRSAFTSAADFSGIDGRRDLVISEVAHKAWVDVSEQGTEAAAATGVAVSLAAVAQPVVFRADRPFLFFIRDTGSGAILFAGRLADPRR